MTKAIAVSCCSVRFGSVSCGSVQFVGRGGERMGLRGHAAEAPVDPAVDAPLGGGGLASGSGSAGRAWIGGGT